MYVCTVQYTAPKIRNEFTIFFVISCIFPERSVFSWSDQNIDNADDGDVDQRHKKVCFDLRWAIKCNIFKFRFETKIIYPNLIWNNLVWSVLKIINVLYDIKKEFNLNFSIFISGYRLANQGCNKFIFKRLKNDLPSIPFRLMKGPTWQRQNFISVERKLVLFNGPRSTC